MFVRRARQAAGGAHACGLSLRMHARPLRPAAAASHSQEAYAEAEADFLGGGRGKGKRRKTGGGGEGEEGDEEDAFFSSLTVSGRLPKFVELLKFKVGGW